MNLLSRETLSQDHWLLLRDAPHLVALAIAASGGSRFDLWLERTAGLRAIRAGRKSDHPLIQAIAADDQIDAAVAALKARNLSRTDALPAAIECIKEAVAVLRGLGDTVDLDAYESFLLGVARSVAEAAREDDFLGFGGNLVSDAERKVIASVSEILSTAS